MLASMCSPIIDVSIENLKTHFFSPDGFSSRWGICSGSVLSLREPCSDGCSSQLGDGDPPVHPGYRLPGFGNIAHIAAVHALLCLMLENSFLAAQ